MKKKMNGVNKENIKLLKRWQIKKEDKRKRKEK